MIIFVVYKRTMNTYDVLGIKRPTVSNIKGGSKGKSTIRGGEEFKPTSKDITLREINNDATVEIYKPKLTRPIMSIYEYAEVNTMLAEYLEAQKSVRQFTNDIEVKSTINPAELAFYSLLENKWNAVLNRGYELVSYSELKYNPQWRDTIANYFKAQHQAQRDELFGPLNLLD